METLDIKNIKPLTEFRNNMKKYIEELKKNKKPIVLTQHGKGTAVLLDAEKYQDLQDQIDFMRKVVLGLEDMKQKKVQPFSDAVREIEQLLTPSENE